MENKNHLAVDFYLELMIESNAFSPWLNDHLLQINHSQDDPFPSHTFLNMLMGLILFCGLRAPGSSSTMHNPTCFPAAL
jgi:hypothetical protein